MMDYIPAIMDKTTLDFIKEHRNDNIQALALQAARYPGIDMRIAVTQIEGWQHARVKLPEWAAVDGLLYPHRISMEQCSSSQTALYKSSLMSGNTFADLTGGFGIDCSYVSRNFTKAYYIERNAELCAIAGHNFALLGLDNIKILNGNSESLLQELPHCDWIFLDPARRDGIGRKVVALSDCEPDVSALHPVLLEKADRVMVKCSPMLDITAACRQLGCVSSIHIVAVNNECKELLLVLSKEPSSAPLFHCVNSTDKNLKIFEFRQDEEVPCRYAENIGRYLYEPNVAILKAGCPNVLTSVHGVCKLHPDSHLYTSDELVTDFPGRIFEVEGAGGFSKPEIKALLGSLKKANITIRNFPDSVQQLRKRLKLSEGGDVYLFATTLLDGSKTLVQCRKAQPIKL